MASLISLVIFAMEAGESMIELLRYADFNPPYFGPRKSLPIQLVHVTKLLHEIEFHLENFILRILSLVAYFSPT